MFFIHIAHTYRQKTAFLHIYFNYSTAQLFAVHFLGFVKGWYVKLEPKTSIEHKVAGCTVACGWCFAEHYNWSAQCRYDVTVVQQACSWQVT